MASLYKPGGFLRSPRLTTCCISLMLIKVFNFCGLFNFFIPLPGGTFSPSRKVSERRRRLQPTMKFHLSIYYILIRKNNNIFRFPSSKRGRNEATTKKCWNKSLGASSEALPVISGSILGPMLFLLYANLLPDVVQSSRLAAFADDTYFLLKQSLLKRIHRRCRLT